jgi:hypothetical protein
MLVGLLYLAGSGYYLEALITFGFVKAFASWYTGTAHELIHLVPNTSFAMLIFFIGFILGGYRKIDGRFLRYIGSLAIMITIFSVFFSKIPFLSFLKMFSIFSAFIGILFIVSLQKKFYSDFFILFIILIFVAEAVHGFNLYHIDRYGQLTRLYAGVW